MTARSTCPHCGTPEAHATEILSEYDGALFYKCSQCRATWHRWSPLHWQHQKAERFIHGPTQDTTLHKEQDNG